MRGRKSPGDLEVAKLSGLEPINLSRGCTLVSKSRRAGTLLRSPVLSRELGVNWLMHEVSQQAR